jgi:hypothetical protein
MKALETDAFPLQIKSLPAAYPLPIYQEDPSEIRPAGRGVHALSTPLP